ncbi:uncharacterized protein HKW66_Vig0012750 [Vigna angularis]|uniref:Uncharacterized protein n=1 Tax=Phaseolus angularis TaxID=3914 RepID=A0A8T0LD07_PHAAN|nr:uncharacterized protein HKW66_Vig0012750 [Vigna angularis]
MASFDLLLQSEVPYAPLRAAWMASDPCTKPEFFWALVSSSPALSPEKVKILAERKAYQELVKDIAPPKDVLEPFSSYKDQLGFEVDDAVLEVFGEGAFEEGVAGGNRCGRLAGMGMEFSSSTQIDLKFLPNWKAIIDTVSIDNG